MNQRIARGIAWSLVALYIALAAIGLTLQILTDTSYTNIAFPVLFIIIPVIGVWPAVGALIISHHPQHPVGWLLSLGLLAAALDMFTSGYVSYNTNIYAGTLPAMTFALIWLKWSGFPFATTAFSLMVLLFPDGRPLSPFWRKVTWTTVAALLLFLPIQAVQPGVVDPFTGILLDNPVGVSPSLWATLEPLWFIGLAMLGICNLAAFISLLLRLREARGDERQQIKWLVIPAGIFSASIPLTIFSLVDNNAQILGIAIALVLPSVAGMVIGTALAIFKYRLYDIDIIINRTLVYGVLTGSVIALYALTVGAFSLLFRSGDNLIVALVATGLVAVLFQPLRERLQRAVDRLMYGDREEPFTVLRRLGRRLESSGMPEDILTAVVETVTQALKLPYAEIAIRHGERYERAAWSGKPTDQKKSFPIHYQGKTIACLIVSPRGKGESLTKSDETLLRQIARQSGPIAQSAQLTHDLRRSRAHLVTAREEERRRLRRDLHDGLGPVLASQGLKIAAVSHLLDSNPEAARKLLSELASQNEVTVAEVRRLVYALRPPELDELGLVGAIRDYAAGLDGNLTNGKGPEIEVGSPSVKISGLPAAVEVAAYRIAMEALTNVTRHAQARHCQVSFCLDENSVGKFLRLEISDDGIGFASDRKSGVGMNSMRERAEEVRGELYIESTPLKGTTVMARLPLAE